MLDIRGFVAIPPRTVTAEWRVLWFRESWRRAPKRRVFARQSDAFRLLRRKQLEGFQVLLQWRQVREWHHSDAESLERHLGPITAHRLEAEAERVVERRADKAERRASLA